MKDLTQPGEFIASVRDVRSYLKENYGYEGSLRTVKPVLDEMLEKQKEKKNYLEEMERQAERELWGLIKKYSAPAVVGALNRIYHPPISGEQINETS